MCWDFIAWYANTRGNVLEFYCVVSQYKGRSIGILLRDKPKQGAMFWFFFVW
jgi:hypothetical protein